jgi:hypothetical protein
MYVGISADDLLRRTEEETSAGVVEIDTYIGS